MSYVRRLGDRRFKVPQPVIEEGHEERFSALLDAACGPQVPPPAHAHRPIDRRRKGFKTEGAKEK